MKMRTNLPPLPDHMRHLPIDERGFPVPWFVQWFADANTPSAQGVGLPDFRVTDSRKYEIAVKQRRCWVCGGILGRWMAFTIGPMCAINRVSGEPPAHRDCAIFSATACPFLAMPKMRRRTNDMPMPDKIQVHPNNLMRNPGVAMVWVTRSYRVNQNPETFDVVCEIGEPVEVLFFAEGRKATKAEIMDSIDSGFPKLQEAAAVDGENAVRLVFSRYKETKKMVEACA